MNEMKVTEKEELAKTGTPIGMNSAPPPYFLKLLLLVLVLGFPLDTYFYSQAEGFKYFKNYHYREYDHHPQNWGMTQAQNGLIYVANQGGVLEYDGVSWRVIGFPEYDPVRSIDIDKNGTVYIGGINKIGYLAPTPDGQLLYVSILDHTQVPIKNSATVWRTHVTKDGIYFRTSDCLFRWDLKNKKMHPIPGKFKASFVCNEDFFVQQSPKGLMKWGAGSFQVIPGGELFAETKIEMLVPYNNNTQGGTLLIGTRSKGFFLYDGKKAVPFPTQADPYLEEKELSHGIRLSSTPTEFAMATLRGGLIIMDRQGNIKTVFDMNYGLQDENVKYVFQDMQGNLWLCLNNGISKIEYASPISIYDTRTNLPGIVLSVLKHQNNLYVGTADGLYYYQSPLKFQPIPDIPGNCIGLLSIGDSILAATAEGVFQIQKYIKQNVLEGISYALLSSTHHPDRVWCGTSNGLVTLFAPNGQWQVERRFPTITQPIRSIVEDRKGNIWLGTTTGQAIKIAAPVDIENPTIFLYSTPDKFPDTEIYAAIVAGNVVFASGKGLFKPENINKNTMIPNGLLGDEFAGGLRSKPVFRLVEDIDKNIWFHSQSKNFQAIAQPGCTYKIDARPFLRIPVVQVNAIYPDPAGNTIWFASVDGLIRFDTAMAKNYQHPFQTLIRRILENENQKDEAQLFGGWECQTGKTGHLPARVIEYSDHNLYFEFAAPFFEAESETQYRYFLKGYQNDWSGWSKNTKKNYTNLHPGAYSFRVQARNIFGHAGKEAEYSFKILPPWYLTWWAFMLYGIGLFSGMYLVIRLRSYKLDRDKKKLEQTIKDRTKEIHEKNQQLSYQSEKLKEMDRVKSRFFANISHEFRTPLTLIMSPLEQLFSRSRDKQQKKEFHMMLRNAQRLLSLINQLLDLSRFDSGKMKLHATCQNVVPFLKGIMGAFEVLARQNQLTMEFIPGEKEISLYFDPQKMEEVMYNLLTNAVKFTPPGGKITVTVARERQQKDTGPGKSGGVTISVQDTGTGINQDEIVHIFDRFYQAENLNVNHYKGTGIGLALTREIIQLHQGTIDVHSQEGKGTEFVINLLSGHKHLKPDEIVLRPDAPLENKKALELKTLYGDFDQESEEDQVTTDEDNTVSQGGAEPDRKEPGEGEQEQEQLEKQVILVVEDNADMRQYIRGPLIDAHYEVVEAVDGEEGICKAREIIPDLIVSDIMMPKVEGYQLCRELKKDMATSHIPIVLLTARVSEESIIHGLQTGADDYVTKPFNTQILLARIGNLIELRRQMQLKIQRQKMLLPAEIAVSSMDDKFLEEFQKVIEGNLSDPGLDIDKLLRKLLMGRTTLFRKVKALTGEKPMEFIQSYRLERAAQLLKKNYGNVTEVAMAVGFSSSAHFSECFKKKFHVSPHSYKVSEDASINR